ncbi:MAG: ABC-2 family transporter protein [Dehalococcoidales bacterium]|nr:ABC-2 family transporter protein [Dehalococcoidales bacterium]
MKAYLSVIRIRFAVQLQYRAAAAAGFFTQLFFGFFRIMVFTAFYASSSAVQPISLEQAITFEWMIQVTLRMIPWNGDDEVVRMIRSGNVAYELCRPMSLYFLWYCRLIALRVVPVLLQGIPLYTLVYFLPGGFGLRPPPSPEAGLAWFLSTLCALLLGCAVSNLISISTLWMTAGEGARRIIPALVLVFSGGVVPLVYFPDWAQQIVTLLPFSGLIEIPLRFYIGYIPPSEVFTYAGLQLGWTAVFILIGQGLLRMAMRRVVIQGG